jgi:hypothetical protein
VGLTAQEAGMSEQKLCGKCCTGSAVIVDLDVEPGEPWCLDCALVLVKVGDPIVNYRELDGGAMYTTTLVDRGTTQTLRFR